MFFGFTEEQKMIQHSVYDMLQEKNNLDDVRQFIKTPKISNKLQSLLGEMGLLGIIDLNSEPGDGKGITNAILIAQEAGRAILPYPLLESIVGLSVLKQCKQHDDLIKEVESCEKVLTIAWKNENAIAVKDKAGFCLTGTLTDVPFARDADVILASVRVAGWGYTPSEEATVVAIDIKNPAVSMFNLHSMDETYPLYKIELNDYSLTTKDVVKGLGMGVGDDLMSQMQELGTLLLSAEMVGCAERVLNETVEYTKQRKQFGTEIARFQALKHMAAEMYLKVESAKVAVEYASWALSIGNEEANIAVSIAKSYASKAATKVTGDAIQMHGGIGFTWENDMHLFFKRARRSASLLGNAYHHRENIAKYAIDDFLKNLLQNKVRS